MTVFPLTNVYQLRDAIALIPGETPLYVRDKDGKSLQVYGVAPVLNDAEDVIGFVLQVGPKEIEQK